jgi:AcrR family transcriptional regulator
LAKTTADARPKRLTRQEKQAQTRERLLEAAERVFLHRGFQGSSVEEISAEAGFTRGAFYSNFASKDELAVAMLDDHLAHSQQRNRALLDRHPDPGGFVQALRDEGVHPDDPLHQNPLLQVELMLYVARTPELRPALARHLRTMRALVSEIVATTLGLDPDDPDATQLGVILVALEDGLRLHRIVAPSATPKTAYFDALESLQRLTTPPRPD